MKTKNIFIATVTSHELEKEPNPRLTREGFATLERLKSLIPNSQQQSLVIYGAGARHRSMLLAFGFNGVPKICSLAAGGPEFFHGNSVILADGTKIDLGQEIKLPGQDANIKLREIFVPAYHASSFSVLLMLAPDNTIICADPTCLEIMGKQPAHHAAVYRVHLTENQSGSSEVVVTEVKKHK